MARRTSTLLLSRLVGPCLVLAIACGSEHDNAAVSSDAGASQVTAHDQPTGVVTQGLTWLQQNTISLRVGLPMTGRGQALKAEQLAVQLAGYDPGSLLHCPVADDAAYRQAVDELGGVTWGYGVQVLEDLSKPRFQAGLMQVQQQVPQAGVATNDTAAAPVVQIVKPDIVAVTDAAALFYSESHGLMLVNLQGAEPQFECATQLPGRIDQFFFHQGHLVVMAKQQLGAAGADASLMHFKVSGTSIRFVESVRLGQVNIIDSRRFNDKLVFYTTLTLPSAASTPPAPGNLPSGFGPVRTSSPTTVASAPAHRSLRVFKLGDTLSEELHDTLIDTTRSESEVVGRGVARDIPNGSTVSEARRFGSNMWASDHYFVVAEEVETTKLTGWQTRTYSECTASHTVESSYEYCWTEYEPRPNPDYMPPDNSGGDRACHGVTLSDCLIAVARVSNKTIQVPVGRKCQDRKNVQWFCDGYQQHSMDYPVMRSESSTQLYVYEYTDQGFVRLDNTVHEITNRGLESQTLSAHVDALTTTSDSFDLAVPGHVQTLRFQNGFLYVISQGTLQVYAMGGSSIVRTSTLQVVTETLQSELFSGTKLFLSDFGYGAGDHSTLKVVDLGNPAFPSLQASTYQLPGGHSAILASQYGILTIGIVQRFQDDTINALKLGLFSNPYAQEKAYLILGTDLANKSLGQEDARYFDASAERLFVPYAGIDETQHQVQRIGLSHVEPDSIVTEGAVVVPEQVGRIRPLSGSTPSALSFSTNAIEWLTPDGREWKTQPVLEYFQPIAVYRLTEDDDYVEVQRLGDRCRLFFANARNINQRKVDNYSDRFDCYGQGQRAYGHRLLLGQSAVEFDDSHAVRALSDAEQKSTEQAIAQRTTCLLSLNVLSNVAVDYKHLPEHADVRCVSPAQLQALQSSANMSRP